MLTTRNVLAAATTSIAMAVVDFSIVPRASPLMLAVGVITAVLVFVTLRARTRLGAVVIHTISGLIMSSIAGLDVGWSIGLALAWPAALAIVIFSGATNAREGSLLHAMSSAVVWLVPAFLCVLGGSLSIALCTFGHRRNTYDVAHHLAWHSYAVMMISCGVLLAVVQLARTMIGFRRHKSRTDLGLGLDEMREDPPVSAYRQQEIVVGAEPRGARTLWVHAAVSVVVLVSCLIALAPVAMYPTAVCMCGAEPEIFFEFCPAECQLVSPLESDTTIDR